MLIDGLDNPEGIAVLPGRGIAFSSGGRIGLVTPHGRRKLLGATAAPNGIAVDARGRIVVANMGRLKGVPGPLQRIDPDTGAVTTLVAAINGRELTSSNDLALARDGTIYCTHTGWGAVGNIGAAEPEGFVYRYRPDGRADVVARGLRSPNGIRLGPRGCHLYVSLTAEGQVVRWPVLADGSLGQQAAFGPKLGSTDPSHSVAGLRALPGVDRARLGYCDGMGFDRAGNLLVTLPLANRIVALTPAGRLVDIVHDPEGARIDFPTNLCWSGDDMRQLIVVSRKGGRIVSARTSISGAPLPY